MIHFSEGDLVLLKLQPYRQQTVVRRASHKLSKRYFGPFTVLRKIGPVAFELDLPPSSQIHPVVHSSLLRPYYGDNPTQHFRPLPNSALSANESPDLVMVNSTDDVGKMKEQPSIQNQKTCDRPNLEDKVPSAADGSVSKQVPKRLSRPPGWLKDFQH